MVVTSWEGEGIQSEPGDWTSIPPGALHINTCERARILIPVELHKVVTLHEVAAQKPFPFMYAFKVRF